MILLLSLCLTTALRETNYMNKLKEQSFVLILVIYRTCFYFGHSLCTYFDHRDLLSFLRWLGKRIEKGHHACLWTIMFKHESLFCK